MKKSILWLFILSMFGYCFATVGGPSLIGDIYYDRGGNSFFYIEKDEGGRGGHIIYNYKMETNEAIVVTGISGLEFDFESEIVISDEAETNNYFINKGFEKLEELQLKKLPISFGLTLSSYDQLVSNEDFTIKSVKPYIFEEDGENYMMSGYITNFVRTNRVYVKNKIQRKTEITTCRLNPINYRGFSLKNLNFVVVIASSERSDCSEGGYVGEFVFPIKYLKIKDSMFLKKTDKTNTIIDNSGTLKQSIGGLYINPKRDGENRIFGKYLYNLYFLLMSWRNH